MSGALAAGPFVGEHVGGQVGQVVRYQLVRLPFIGNHLLDQFYFVGQHLLGLCVFLHDSQGLAVVEL